MLSINPLITSSDLNSTVTMPIFIVSILSGKHGRQSLRCLGNASIHQTPGAHFSNGALITRVFNRLAPDPLAKTRGAFAEGDACLEAELVANLADVGEVVTDIAKPEVARYLQFARSAIDPFQCLRDFKHARRHARANVVGHLLRVLRVQCQYDGLDH